MNKKIWDEAERRIVKCNYHTEHYEITEKPVNAKVLLEALSDCINSGWCAGTESIQFTQRCSNDKVNPGGYYISVERAIPKSTAQIQKETEELAKVLEYREQKEYERLKEIFE